MSELKCLYCGSNDVGIINDHKSGQYYGLTEVIIKDGKKAEIYGNNIVPLNVVACKKCAGIMLLKREENN